MTLESPNEEKTALVNKIPSLAGLVVERQTSGCGCDKLGMSKIHQQDELEFQEQTMKERREDSRKGCGQ